MRVSTATPDMLTHTAITPIRLRLRRTLAWMSKAAMWSQKTPKTWPIEKKSKYH